MYAASAEAINAALVALTDNAQRQQDIAQLHGELAEKLGENALLGKLSDLYATRHLALVECAYDLGSQHGFAEAELMEHSGDVDRFSDDLLMMSLCSGLTASETALALGEVARAALMVDARNDGDEEADEEDE